MIVLTNVKKLYDGSSGSAESVLTGVDLTIEDGLIHSILPHGKGPELGPDHPVIDASSYTITPGIIDCHGHITLLGISESDLDRLNSDTGLFLTERILHDTLVRGGVTTLRDVGGATHQMKRWVDDGTLIGPRLKISICMLSTTGGHADFRGPDRCHAQLSKLLPPGPGRPSSIVDGPWECRKRVREIAACGADLIKICSSPGVASPSDKLEHEEFSAKEVEAICEQAAARGLKVAAHAHSQSGIDLAIQHGVSDIQHISFMDERQVDDAHARGCTVTPTSWVIHVLRAQKNLSPAVAEKAKQVAEVHAKAVSYARSGGLTILAGTDAVLPGMHGRNYMEIVALTWDGLTPLEAWYAATGAAAKEIGLPDCGVLRKGMRADLLISRDDVIERPELLDEGALLEVVKDGIAYRNGVAGLPQRSFQGDVARWLGDDESEK